MRKLLLFDIDGTLLGTDGAAGRAFEAALIDVYGTAGPIGETSFAGKTDPQIAHELLAAAGLSRPRVERDLDDLWQRYLQYLDGELVSGVVRVCPGVSACLELIENRTEDAILGLLTGNIEPGARRKLEASGLGFRRFRVGVFGSDHEERDALPAIAASRAESLTGRPYRGDAVVIIGDTPADVRCGEAFGARTVAVATGSYDRGALIACDPDYFFDSLEDTATVWDAMMS